MTRRPFRDYYDIIGVAPEAPSEEITRVYRELAHLYHDDTLRGKAAVVRKRAEQQLKRVNEAYACLHDPKRRAEYDSSWREFHGSTGEQDTASGDTKEKAEEWECSGCGRMNSMVRAFCAECGFSRDEAVEARRRAVRVVAIREERRQLRDTGVEICPACGGFKNALDAGFCGGCGEDLEEFWLDGPETEEYKKGLLATYGLSPDEVFESVIETLTTDRIFEWENLERRLTVRVHKGLFDTAGVEIRVADRPDRGCDLLVIPGPNSRAETLDVYEKILQRIHTAIEEKRFG